MCLGLSVVGARKQRSSGGSHTNLTLHMVPLPQVRASSKELLQVCAERIRGVDEQTVPALPILRLDNSLFCQYNDWL